MLLKKIGEHLLADSGDWALAREKAALENSWFIPEFVQYQAEHLAAQLQPDPLQRWVEPYAVPPVQDSPRNIGLVMAGNIPLSGFHDFLCVFLSGHRQTIKPSSKDSVLIRHIAAKLQELDPATAGFIGFSEKLSGCDAYIATGSNNSARYFDYYFGKYPHIIRRNRSSAAVLTGDESAAELSALADDIYLYFGLGCRNVTKIYVPENYDFVPLLDALKKYDRLSEHHKYKNNYDYQLAAMIINGEYYMTNGTILLRKNTSLFSPISQLHYEFYAPSVDPYRQLSAHPDIQCVVGRSALPFGQAQRPALSDYADKADTLQFLLDL